MSVRREGRGPQGGQGSIGPYPATGTAGRDWVPSDGVGPAIRVAPAPPPDTEPAAALRAQERASWRGPSLGPTGREAEFTTERVTEGSDFGITDRLPCVGRGDPSRLQHPPGVIQSQFSVVDARGGPEGGCEIA